MSKKLLSCGLVIVCLLGIMACKPGKKKAEAQVEREWFRYISAYTSGVISRKSEIRVLFVNNAATPGQSAAGLLDFSPDIPGTAEWRSLRELVFTPKNDLIPSKEYKATLHVGRILKLPKAFDLFTFGFTVIRPAMEVQVLGLFSEDPAHPSTQILKGQVDTSDKEEPALVEKVIEAEQMGRKLAVEWSHAMDGLGHYFKVKDVERTDTPSEVRVTWDGEPIHVDKRGARDIDVPALGEFQFVSAEAVLAGTRHVLLRFSDTLAKDQKLQGLIRIENRPLTFEIDGNVIRVYSTRDFMGSVPVLISPGIRNFANRRLPRPETREVFFESIRPQVLFVGKGVILPRKDRLTVPIEAVNLRAIQVAAFQIYGNDVAQFLQVNDLEGSTELARVGRFLWRKTIALSEDPSVTGAWSRYELDVTSLFQENPGSIFRLILSFNRGNSTYPCPESTTPVVAEPALRNKDDAGESYWDYYTYNYEATADGWSHRNDPCHDAYYNPMYFHGGPPQALVGRNFLASNVGLLAKLEENGTLHVVTTDIGTARPQSDARVRAYNYQNQLLGEASSDGNGFAVLKLKDRPFFISAQSGTDIGYLRINKDSALPVSQFDVGGEAVRKGIKGSIYGERGVWRPGDALYLTFVLFDRDRVLPAGHPVLMEIYSPQGQLVETLKPEKTVEPFYAFRFQSDEAAPTGNWRARVLVGGLNFTKVLKIETVIPNRLKIDFKTGRELLTRKDVPIEAAVASQWLHGAPASNLKFDVTVRLAPRPTRFEKYQSYSFDDPATEFTGGEAVAEKGVLDAEGRGRVKLDFAPKQPSPGMLDASFVTRVFEESGDFSIDSFSQPYHPYDAYVGILTPKGDAARGMLLTDKDHTVDIVTLDPSGRPIPREKLKASLYKLDWRWWWDKSGESLAQYVSSKQTTPLLSGEVSTPGGTGQWTFQIKYPDWGRYLIRVEDPEGGHTTGRIVFIDWPGWAGRSREEAGAGATRLNFTSDKPVYQVGEKAVIFLPEAVQGRALVSVENGSSVLQKMWVSTQKGENRFEIPLSKEMTPNVYVHVTLLQPHSGKVSDTPIRLYGVIPVVVENPETRLEPAVVMADEVKPNEKFKVQVREKNRRPMTYTLAVVDEGLLGLTRYSAPDLRKEFYNREALGVVTWDLFDEVVEAYGAELSRILALGGDEGAAAKDKARKPRRFPPVVLFAGPFELKEGETASHELEMPQYFGAVRAMVVAGRDGAFGSAEKSVLVRRDLMALPTLPRVVRPGEDVTMPIAVFVTNPSLKNVEVSVETNKLFSVVGESTKSVSFAQPGDEIISFALKTADAVGQGEVRFRVSSGSERIEDAISVPVLGSNPMITETTRLEVKPGQTLSQAVTPFGLENTNTVTVEASPLPPLNLEKRLDFLIRYPHGCIEQTLSAAFPQLYLKGLVRLDDKQQKEIQRHMEAAIEKLSRFQMPNGAFSYWPGGHEAHEWSTTYAGWFLLETARLGYRVPQSMLDRWRANQKMMANMWTAGDSYQQLTQAFRLFTLALARDPDLGAMNRLREAEGLAGIAAVELAAAFHITGQTDAAADLTQHADLKVVRYRDYSLTFGSDFRDQALLVRCLVQMDRLDKAKPLVDEIVKVAGSDLWLSTHETAYALMALASFYGTGRVKPFRYRLAWDGESPQDVEASVPFDKRVYENFPVKGRTLAVTNDGESTLYVNIYRRGMPPAGGEPESANDLSIEVNYRDLKMNQLDIGSVSQGLDIVVDIRVRNMTQRALDNLVLTHLVAAGYQIKNPRFTGESGTAADVDYQDIRDDRVYTYFSLAPGRDKTFLITLNASYRGRYYQPGPVVEAMYEAAVHANAKGQWIKIVQ
jgi:uncharacterized protein YfaS (alpha-2-macroglobulin family)